VTFDWGRFIYILCWVLIAIIFLRAFISWFPVNPRNPFVVILYRITEPILMPLRRIIPRVGVMDITPMVAVVLLLIIGNVARWLL
jgi:YggT family protein